jgi:Tfp pilus assembly PilM family ATPase
MHWDVVRSYLTEFVMEQRLNGEEVAICLPAHLVRMQRISLPIGLSEAEIAMEIRLLLQRDLPGMKETLCIDFKILSQNKDEIDIFFVAMREEHLLQYVECAEAAGLRVKVVDVDVFAITRAVSGDLPLLRMKERHALVYFIDNSVTLVGFDAEIILFHQYWELTEAEDFSIQLNHYLQLNLSVYPPSGRMNLLIYGVNGNLSLSNNESIVIHPIDPFAKMIWNKDKKPAIELSYYLLAYGLAMRQRPLW